MNIGDSFLIKGKSVDDDFRKKINFFNNKRSGIHKSTELRFVSRTMKEGVRIWRIK